MASAFQKAFAAARKSGKKEFTWNGKNYNTELKETVRPKARGTKSVAAPAKAKSDLTKLKENIETSRRSRETARNVRRAAKAPVATGPRARPNPKASPFSSENSDFDARQAARKAAKKKTSTK